MNNRRKTHKKYKLENRKYKTHNNKILTNNPRLINQDIYRKISTNVYEKHKLNNNIPIECLISICLLLNGDRRIIQYDRYLYTLKQWNGIKQLLNDKLFTINGSKIIKLTTQKNDIIVYLDNNLTSQIKELGINNVIESNLDTKFYNNCEYNTNKLKNNISRVSINIMGPVETGDVVNNINKLKDLQLKRKTNYFGQLLLMECNDNEINRNIKNILDRFYHFKKNVWKIDTNLQLSLEIYTKNGIWENQPFLKTKSLTYTD